MISQGNHSQDMRAVIQRVSSASVAVEGMVISSIESGLLILLGIEEADDSTDIEWLTKKIASLRILEDAEGQMAVGATAVFYFILLNLFLGMFNLLPIPPFDGSHIVGGLLPDRMRAQWVKLQQIGMVLLLGLIAASWVFGTGWIARFVMPPVIYVLDLFLAVSAAVGGG